MDERFVSVAFQAIEGEVKRHLARLPSAIDSFLEDHILGSAHVRIMDGDAVAGFASVHEESVITQFAVAEAYRGHGQRRFWALRQPEQVRSAFVSTCDEYYMSHALDDCRAVANQAYVFAAGPGTVGPETRSTFGLRAASPDDAGLIRSESGDFFEPLDRRIATGQLFLTLRGGEPVGFGLIERSTLYADVASIGMYTIDRHRRQGVGAATIALLRGECRHRQWRPVAGCWYYNHRSKRTLERAGMYAASRLLRVEY